MDEDEGRLEALEMRAVLAEDRAHQAIRQADLLQAKRRSPDQLERIAWIWILSVLVVGLAVFACWAVYWTSIPNPHPRVEWSVSCPSGEPCPVPGVEP